jgi:DnaJ-domain-containing protein 1
MRQIFDRLNKFVKSEVNSSKFENRFHQSVDEDDELKNIIDELENEKKQEKSNNNPKDSNSKLNLNDAYIILGLESTATKEQIKASYKKKLTEYHPDKVAALGVDLQNLAQAKTLEINKAYEIMKENGKV